MISVYLVCIVVRIHLSNTLVSFRQLIRLSSREICSAPSNCNLIDRMDTFSSPSRRLLYNPCRKYGHREKVCKASVSVVKIVQNKLDMYLTSLGCVMSSLILILVPGVQFPTRASIMNIFAPIFPTFLRKVSSPFQAGSLGCAAIDWLTVFSITFMMNCFAMLFHRKTILEPSS